MQRAFLRRLCGAAFLTVTLSACSSGRIHPSQNPAAEPADSWSAAAYYHGVETPYSAPISELGDVDILGPESTMKEALVAGDENLLVAASLFESGDVVTLDLIVLNGGEEIVSITREDLFIVDAEGQWLTQMPDWEGGQELGLRGRQSEGAHELASNLPYYEVDYGSRALAYQSQEQLDFDQALQQKHAANTPSTTPSRGIARHEQEIAFRDDARTGWVGSPRMIEIPAQDGRAFWGYFEKSDQAFPLTAVVLVGGEQLLFRFERQD